MSIPILESKRDEEWERMNERVKNYKSIVDNNRKLGQEAFGNEASDRTAEDEREWMERAADKGAELNLWGTCEDVEPLRGRKLFFIVQEG